MSALTTERDTLFSPPAWGWSEPFQRRHHQRRVLPTRVGMVRGFSDRVVWSPGSPHPRGDGPPDAFFASTRSMFSPPAWGWSVGIWIDNATNVVLPTRVGMVRRLPSASLGCPCSPHPRGDGPVSALSSLDFTLFSPPAWGWSGATPRSTPETLVLPTRVGMVRARPLRQPHDRSSPHPRGDGPKSASTAGLSFTFSPPAWGWSVGQQSQHILPHVLPTRVGMVRRRVVAISPNLGSPHPRGDGPSIAESTGITLVFSPPAWGWSAAIWSDEAKANVLPTRVGMVRTSRSSRIPTPCSPHPRGDGPATHSVTSFVMAFSPPAWGWSVCLKMSRPLPPVLPTRVGMVRGPALFTMRFLRSPHPRGDGPSA